MNNGKVVTMIQGGTLPLDAEIMQTYIEAFRDTAKEVLCELAEYGTGVQYEVAVYVEYKKAEVERNGR